MFAGTLYLFLRFKDGREFCQINPSQTLMNLQKFNPGGIGLVLMLMFQQRFCRYIDL